MALNYGLNYSTISGPMGGVGDLSFQIGNAFGGASGAACGSSILSGAGLEQWRVPQTQQFPFLAGLEGSQGSGLYPFEGSAEVTGYGAGGGVSHHHVRPKVSTSGVLAQLASVKMEDSRDLSLSGQFLGSNNVPPSEQYWTTTGTSAAWTDLSGFSSSSTTSNNQL